MSDWITANASVTGVSHHKTGIPCQDASIVRVDSSGEWIVAVVSDGAGTARRAEEGSSLIVDIFSNSLLALSAQLEIRKPGHWINDFVIWKILEARNDFRQKAGSDNISDFNCTLVACLLGPTGGFSIHIGDGAIFGGNFLTANPPIDISSEERFFMSSPENGEYANETYFITEGDWVKHLRINPMPALDWFFVCTDGGTALSLLTDKEPKFGFVLPVLKEVTCVINDIERNSKLAEILENPQANKVTDDDKTLVVVCRRSKRDLIASISMDQLSNITPSKGVQKKLIDLPENQLQTAPSVNKKELIQQVQLRRLPALRILIIFTVISILVGAAYAAYVLYFNSSDMDSSSNKSIKENRIPENTIPTAANGPKQRNPGSLENQEGVEKSEDKIPSNNAPMAEKTDDTKTIEPKNRVDKGIP